MQLRDHLFIFGGMLLACLLFANSISLVYIAIFTLGLGVLFALGLVNVTFVYALMMPGLVLRALGWRSRWRGLFASILVFAVPLTAAILPPVLSYATAQISIARATGSDKDDRPPEVGQAVPVTLFAQEFVRSGRNAQPGCGAICQNLLAEGIASYVSARARKGRLSKPEAAVTYRLRPGVNCPAVLREHTQPVPRLLERRAAGECLVSAPSTPGEREAAGFVVEVASIRPKEAGYANVRGLKRVRIGWREDGNTKEIFRKTEVSTERLAFPLHLAVDASGPHGFPRGWKFAQKRRKSGAFDADATVLALLGKEPEPVAPQSPGTRQEPGKLSHAEYTRVIQRLLASPQTAAFEPSLSNVVNAWMRTRGRKSGPQFEEMLIRIARDRRFVDIPLVFIELRSRPDALRQCLPALVGRLEAPPPAEPELAKKGGSYDFDRANIAYAFRSLEAEDLAPYADRLVALARRTGESWTAGLIAILPKLDRDPVGVLKDALRSKRWETRRRAAQAICQSAPRVQEALKPALLATLQGKSSDDRRAVARALVRMGEKEAVERKLSASRDRRRYLFERGVELTAGFDVKYCTR